LTKNTNIQYHPATSLYDLSSFCTPPFFHFSFHLILSTEINSQQVLVSLLNGRANTSKKMKVKVETNTRNLVLNGPTMRCSNLTQSLSRAVPEVHTDEPIFEFSPPEPSWGMLQVNCVYHLTINVRTNGADVSRFRLIPPPLPSDDSTALKVVNISSTKLIPGLHERLTLEVKTLAEGPFEFSFVIVGELQTYTLTSTGHVLPADGFHAVAALAKLEGRPALEPGVRFVSELHSARLDSLSGPNRPKHDDNKDMVAPDATSNATERDTLDGLYDPNQLDLEDVGAFPSLPGVYWDRNLNQMCLHKPCFKSIVIDGSKGLEEVVETNDRSLTKMMMELEGRGHLTSRCLESLRLDGRVPREVFRTLSLAANNTS